MYPDWVTKHKQKGTNIAHINGHYYLYAVTSIWNKEKQRAQKITKQYLGRITQQGLIPPKTNTQKTQTPPTVKEYGATHTLTKLGTEILTNLQKNFTPTQANQLFTIAALKVINPNPLKRTQTQYQTSYLSELYPNLKLSSKELTEFLKTIGTQREAIVAFMKPYLGKNEYILFDGTSLISKSEKLHLNRKGYNAHHDFDPQINLLYAFASKSKMPAYYRIIPGNVREVSAFKLCVSEAGLQDVIVIADKGFGSEANFNMLAEAKLDYIVPLKRNSVLFDAGRLKTGDKADFEGYFMFNDRPIWYYRVGVDVVVFLDSVLKCEEEKRYLGNIKSCIEGYDMAGFLEGQFKFGTIVLKSTVAKDPCVLYGLYKARGEIEQSFDFLKNFLEQDKSYMQSEQSLEAWAFINHISLLLNYRVYNLLREKELLAKFSVADFLSHLKYIFKVKINDEWHLSEITKKTSKFLETLNLPIT